MIEKKVKFRSDKKFLLTKLILYLFKMKKINLTYFFDLFILYWKVSCYHYHPLYYPAEQSQHAFCFHLILHLLVQLLCLYLLIFWSFRMSVNVFDSITKFWVHLVINVYYFAIRDHETRWTTRCFEVSCEFPVS